MSINIVSICITTDALINIVDNFYYDLSLHYENTPIQIYRKFHLQKPEIFS